MNTRFAALLSGDVPAAKPLPDDFIEKPWAGDCGRAAGEDPGVGRGDPAGGVDRHDAIAALEASAVKMARAFDTLTPERGGGIGVTNQLVGTINLYQVGEWAASHAARHDAQAQRALN